jgi:hypothetical protein
MWKPGAYRDDRERVSDRTLDHTGVSGFGLASAGWIAERLFDKHTSVDPVAHGIAHQAVWVASSLLLLSLILWRFTRDTGRVH